MASVKISNLKKEYGAVQVLHSLDLEVADGKFVVLLGPSGCGKSTLLRMIAGLEPITAGDVYFDETRVNDVHAKDRNIAMVFQNYALYAHMSVRKNMAFSMRLKKMDKKVIDEKVEWAASILGLEPYLDRLPKELSGGQRQRVAMGRAIVRDPDVFLFDEPLSNLDAKLRVQMRTEIKDLHQRLKTTTVYVTHDQIEAMTMADKIVVLKDGHVEQHGSPLELYTHPKNLFVAGFIGSPRMNFMPVTLESNGAEASVVKLPDGQSVSLDFDTSAASVGDVLMMGLRPEDLSSLEGDFSFELKVALSEHLGGTSFLYGEYGDNDNFVVERSGSDRTKSGESVAVSVNSKSAYLFDKNDQAFQRRVEV